MGANFFVHGTDLDLVCRTLNKELGEFKKLVGDTRNSKDDGASPLLMIKRQDSLV